MSKLVCDHNLIKLLLYKSKQGNLLQPFGILDLFVIYDNNLCRHTTTKSMLTVNISPRLIMAQACNYKLYYKKRNFFLNINENTQNLYFKLQPSCIYYVKIIHQAFLIRNEVESLKK